jgi:hypothetical protein
MVSDVSKELTASIFKVKRSKQNTQNKVKQQSLSLSSSAATEYKTLQVCSMFVGVRLSIVSLDDVAFFLPN